MVNGDIDDAAILDETIRELQNRIAETDKKDPKWLKYTDRLLKALSMRSRQKKARGRGFNLGSTQ